MLLLYSYDGYGRAIGFLPDWYWFTGRCLRCNRNGFRCYRFLDHSGGGLWDFGFDNWINTTVYSFTPAPPGCSLEVKFNLLRYQ